MPSMGIGGAEKVLLNLLKELPQNKFKIYLYVFEFKGELWDLIPKHIIKKHIFLPRIINKIGLFLLRNYSHKWIFDIYAMRIKSNFDVGISFLDSPYTYILTSHIMKIEKKITVIHSSYLSYSNKSKFLKGSYLKLMQKRYCLMDNIICVSNESMNEFNKIFDLKSKTSVIYNPISKKNISKLSKDKIDKDFTKNKTFKFIAVGSIIPVKDYELLIESAVLLKEKKQILKLIL